MYLEMKGNPLYSKSIYRDSNLKIVYDAKDRKRIYGSDVRLILQSTKDSTGTISIEKKASGDDYLKARDRARELEFQYEFKNNTLYLDGFFLTNIEHQYRGQNIEIIIKLPIGSVLFADENTYSFHRNTSIYNDILENGKEEHFLKVARKSMRCLDCSNLNENP